MMMCCRSGRQHFLFPTPRSQLDQNSALINNCLIQKWVLIPIVFKEKQFTKAVLFCPFDNVS